MSRALGIGLLVAAGTAASLTVADLHGIMILLALVCAALCAGAAAYFQFVQKKSWKGYSATALRYRL